MLAYLRAEILLGALVTGEELGMKPTAISEEGLLRLAEEHSLEIKQNQESLHTW